MMAKRRIHPTTPLKLLPALVPVFPLEDLNKNPDTL